MSKVEGRAPVDPPPSVHVTRYFLFKTSRVNITIICLLEQPEYFLLLTQHIYVLAFLVGLGEDELELLAYTGKEAIKTSRRDFVYVLSQVRWQVIVTSDFGT